MGRVPGIAVALALALGALTGCLTTDSGRAAEVVPAAFTTPDAEWVAMAAGGCGFCLGAGGFEHPPEHAATFVFRDGHALLVRWNTNVSADDGFHVAPDVAFDADALENLLRHSDRARGEVFVLNVTTGAVAPAEDVIERLDASWAAPASSDQCADYGAEYAHRDADGVTRAASVTCPVGEGNPLHAFASTVHGIRDGLRALEA